MSRLRFSWLAALSLALLAVPAPAAEAPRPPLHPLVAYSFEHAEGLDDGPDSFAVFERGHGSVRPSRLFRVSGETSLELRDLPGDGDFPELQAYFPVQRHGRLYLHFAFLLTDLEQEWNAALAGPAGFRLGRDGILWWLSFRDGWLSQHSDSIPRRLFRPAAFVWYHVDVELDLDAGHYALSLQEEGAETPLLVRREQPAAAGQTGSAIDKFSFIGDRGSDDSAALYYVDDVYLASSRPPTVPSFVAPGRRRLLVERWSELDRSSSAQCPPLLGPEDLGDAALDPGVRRGALHDWRGGCAALARGDLEAALAHLGNAVAFVPRSPLYAGSYLVALVRAAQWRQAEGWLAWLESEWGADPRLPRVAAFAAEALGDTELALAQLAGSSLTEAEERVLAGAFRRLSALGSPAQWHRLEEVERSMVRVWLAETARFGVLLRRGEHEEAAALARQLARQAAREPRAAALWLERAGDASFLAGDAAEAELLYRQALDLDDRNGLRLVLKLSDVAWRRGDLAEERRLREAIYGRSIGF